MTFLRSVVFNLFFYAITFGCSVWGTALRFRAPEKVLPVAMVWARVLLAGSRIICGIKLDVRGLENIPPGPVLIASRHQSAFDTFVWLTLLPRACYVFKHELLNIPLFGPLVAVSGMIPVDREAGGAAIRALLREASRAKSEQRQIIIFPEGTRAEPGRKMVLQAGVAALAAHTQLPVIPVSTDSGYCWGRRAFRKRAGTIHIDIGAAIPPQTDRKALMQALEQGLSNLDRL
jgi:1-acyl-sn-glycerol-3-phosphate acyltransferase